MFVIKYCKDYDLVVNICFQSMGDAIKWINEYNKQYPPLNINWDIGSKVVNDVYITKIEIWDGTF